MLHAPALELPVALQCAGYAPPDLTDYQHPYRLWLACPYTPPTLADLVIAFEGCAVTPEPPSGDLTGTLTATLPAALVPLSLRARAHWVVEGSAHGALPPARAVLRLSAAMSMDLALPNDTPSRYPASVRARQQRPSASEGYQLRHTEGVVANRRAGLHQTEAAPIGSGLVAPQTAMDRLSRFTRLLATDGITFSARTDTTQTETIRHRRSVRMTETESQAITANTHLPHAERIYTRNRREIREQEAVQTAEWLDVGHHTARDTWTRLSTPQTEAMWPLPGRWLPECYEPPGLNLVLYCNHDYHPRSLACLIVLCICNGAPQPHCPDDPDPRPPTHQIPIRRVYFMLHDVSLRRQTDGVEVPCASLSLSLDVDSWAWSWSASLIGSDAVDAIAPMPNGAPRVLVAQINDYEWYLLAEDWSESRAFAKRTVNASGRGLTAELAAPYRLPGDGTSTEAQTLQQLFAGLIPLDATWAIDWAPFLPDWSVPAGAWSYSGLAPIQAMHDAAQGVGLVLVPDRTHRRIRVQARDPAPPWELVPPALGIPEAAILSMDGRPPNNATANAVYVHGGDTGGVMGRVLRQSSAGDVHAPVVSHPLVTHVDAVRTLGTRILAAHHAQPTIRSLTIPLGGDYPLPSLGDRIRVQLASGNVDGNLSALSIAVTRSESSLTVRQTLRLGADSGNAWARWMKLLPADPLLVGDIVGTYEDGTALVELISGGHVRARNRVGASGRVYLRGRLIEGQAPAFAWADEVRV